MSKISGDGRGRGYGNGYGDGSGNGDGNGADRPTVAAYDADDNTPAAMLVIELINNERE